jgi:multicomponent Na+:H+ antiporter subunit C
MIGLFAMISKNNLIKKLIGMTIFQTAIILFYVSLSTKKGATIPITDGKGVPGTHSELVASGQMTFVETFGNPLPHVLMLTAIVVGVATLGVALAISQVIYRDYGTLEEDELLEKIESGSTTSDL